MPAGEGASLEIIMSDRSSRFLLSNDSKMPMTGSVVAEATTARPLEVSETRALPETI